MGKKKVRSDSTIASNSNTNKMHTVVSATATDQQHLKLDTRGDGMYSGTFRWLESKHFPKLPAFSSTHLHRQRSGHDSNDSCNTAPLAKGWEGYLAVRSDVKTNLVAVASQDPSCLDALSFPVTLLHVVQMLSIWKPTDSEKHILIIGASSKAEQRIWRITDYWHELARFFPATNVRLWFIGPEVQEDNSQGKSNLPSNLSVQHFRGTFGAFQDSHASHDCTPEDAVIVGFNTGFGNFVDSQYYGLLFGWLPDLYKIADSNIPAIFTCANDYADMNGEFAVQSRVIGAKMLLLPQQNPFSCASHLHEEGQRETAWSRGNSFLYATQGYDSSRRLQLAPGDVTSLLKRLDAELDLHLQDSLGRHFFRGMVLSKEQASRCNALTGGSTKAAPVVKSTNATSDSASPSTLEKPQLKLIQGASSKEVVALVYVPKMLQPSERVAVDLSDSTLSVFVPGKYFLREKLPFTVAERGSTADIRAELTLPVLRVTFMRN